MIFLFMYTFCNDQIKVHSIFITSNLYHFFVVKHSKSPPLPIYFEIYNIFFPSSPFSSSCSSFFLVQLLLGQDLAFFPRTSQGLLSLYLQLLSSWDQEHELPCPAMILDYNFVVLKINKCFRNQLAVHKKIPLIKISSIFCLQITFGPYDSAKL